MKKKFIYIIALVAAVALIAFVLTKNKEKNENEQKIVSLKNSSISIRVDTVETKPIEAQSVSNGTFMPSQELKFSAENSGRVQKVLVDEGDVVRIGQTLAIIKGDKLSVDVVSARAAYDNAVADAKRYENAFKTGGVTKQQLDQAQLTLSNAKAKLDQANISFGDASIKATINGIVNKKMIEPGSVVSPGTELFELVNVSKLKLTVTVPEAQVPALKKGNTVKVKASVYPDKEFSGKISFIAPKADESLNFPVEIEIANNPNNELKAGMYGTADFGGSEQQKPIRTISRNAFVGGVNAGQVFIVKDSVATLKKITPGRVFGDKVEVLDGLQDGEIVVISGQINLTNGAKVSILK
ncbi:efflux RND transporter periplasmic adaptor subunit [Flavobacterium silvaticum]|uniref:Efflux RND transporter periplasmic adaptor subunit n=1 Tax=Flavobacterium silvaticum TaxID=1852020 RepID=A0A972FV88_9FLAO|nr:efflux RND transporter periplasmic adaptor subunit [Flavobacterium silvaticum]NMH28687.1 efflux RND transporter periplasmic adaptor subunit [Flavobacterium silvaticum]